MLCPDTDDVLGFLDGRCSAGDAERFEDHVDGCTDCRALIVALGQVGVHDPATGASPEQRADDAAAPGSRLGRYVVVDDLGEGAMGRVLRAHDPELGRDIALKLVRVHGETSPRAQQRLVREAQAMARLAHPNVVAVHDTGTFGGDVFVAMELVKGCDLATWLRRARRPWTEVAGVFVQAGRGLAAAHAAGIVHRDFKPANVLVGDDGRVRVTDFGLAAVVGEVGDEPLDPADRSIESSASASPRLTATGTVMGTPAYMSPEARRGVAIGEASDQYSFCVALCEALAGRRPDGAGDAREAELPRRIRPILARGLSRRPEERFASMSALVDALARASAPRAARRIAAAVAVVAIGAAAAGYAGAARELPAAACPAPRDRVAAVWGDTHKRAARRAFEATGAPAATSIWRQVEVALDRHVGAWVDGHVAACEATEVQHQQSGELLDRRMACLDGELERVAAIAETLVGADAEVVDTALAAVESLTGRLSRCADTAGLRDGEPLPADPAIRRRVDELGAELSRIELLNVRGRHRDAVERGRALVAEAEGAGSARLLASARIELGNGLWHAGELAAAEDEIHRGIAAARQARAWDVEAGGMVSLVGLLESGEARYGEALQVAQLAAAAVRAHGDDVTLARLIGSRGAIHWMKGDIAAAAPDFERALELMSGALDPGDRRVGQAIANVAMVFHVRDQLEPALEQYGRALAIYEQVYGRRHPDVANLLSNRSSTLFKLGRRRDALRDLTEALDIRRELLGPDHTEVAVTLEAIAEIEHMSGDHSAALVRFREAEAILARAVRADHPERAVALAGQGRALVALGRAKDAIAPLERALDIWEEGGVDGLPDGVARLALSRALWQTARDRRRARALAIRARDSSSGGTELRAEATRWLNVIAGGKGEP